MNIGQSRASLKELGIPEKAMRASRIHPGRLEILPAKYYNPISSIGERFRMSLERHSHVIPLFRGWRLIPYAEFQAWQEEWQELQNELVTAKQAIFADYELIRKGIVDDFTELAAEAHKALVQADGEWAEPFESFRQHIVERALSKLPTRQHIDKTVLARYTTMQLIDEITYEERLLALQERVNAANQRHNDNVAAAQQLEREAMKLKAMHEAERAHLQKQLEETTNPINDVMMAVRAEIVKQVKDALEVVRVRGYLPGRTAQKLEGLRALAQVKASCCIEPDFQLDDLLTELQGKLKLAPAKNKGDKDYKYDADAVAETMREIVNLTLGDDTPSVDPRKVRAWQGVDLED
jgi:hypothetical protein